MAKVSAVRVVDQRAGKLIGPITAMRPSGDRVHQYTFSEIAVCEWTLSDRSWVTFQALIAQSAHHTFEQGTLLDVTMSAWPCSPMGDSASDAAWAIESWAASISSVAAGDVIDVTIDITAKGKGVQRNRIGYAWTAYVRRL
jgi:hypothetical protein